MGIGHHSLGDREFLRTKSDKELQDIQRRLERSINELKEYREAVVDVRTERTSQDSTQKL